MKLLNLVPVLLVLVISVTAVMATHVPQVSLQPNEWASNTVSDVSLKVANSVGDDIVVVELSVPESDSAPLYAITEISTPAGWTYDTRVRVGQSAPYKVTWSTTGEGIKADDSLDFGLTVQSPKDAGEYVWSWITTDAKGDSQTGTVKTKIGQAPVASLKITAPTSVKAGNSFKITVTAYDSSNKVKTDYDGSVSFVTTDPLAILPSEYKFVASDNGNKEFTVKMKTEGVQTISVSDVDNKISAISNSIDVGAGSLVSLAIMASNQQVNAGDVVVLNAIGSDVYGNKVDVTSNTAWNIDNEAGGSWVGNSYKTEVMGLWTVTGSYGSLTNGITLSVGGEAIPPTQEIPEEEIPEEQVPGTQMAELAITGEDSIIIPAGSNDTTVLTVSNEGNVDLTGVKLGIEGIPSDWVLIFPTSSDISVDSSKDYLVIIYVPANETSDREITFTASSNQGATAEMNETLRLSAPPTGLLEMIPTNVLQLGVVIIAVAAVIIIGWELWFKK